ncbi:MAG: phage/plasmid primase, P4 family [Candidatus Thermoplasmatota archaeon]
MSASGADEGRYTNENSADFERNRPVGQEVEKEGGGTGVTSGSGGFTPELQNPTHSDSVRDSTHEDGKDPKQDNHAHVPTRALLNRYGIDAVPTYPLQSLEHEVNGLGLHENGDGRRFAIHHAGKLCYVVGWGWLHYEGGKWSRISDVAVQEFARKTADDLLVLAGQAKGDSVHWRDLHKHAFGMNRATRLWRMVELARSDPAIWRSPASFDREPHLLNCRNGVVDLKTGKLRPHTPTDYFTRQVPFDYHEPLIFPLDQHWRRFLKETTGGDKELERFLQMAAGYALTGETNEQCLFFLYGDGSNGKSTFLETLRHVMAEYSDTAKTDFLMADRNNSNQKNATVARLQGVRMVTVAEAGENRSFDESFLKVLTGDESVEARRLYNEAFSTNPSFKVWIHGNTLPRIGGTDDGIWRRFHLVPFTQKVSEAKRDLNLKSKLKADASEILCWMVEGARRWYAEGLQPPQSIRRASSEYRSDMDVLSLFLTEECVYEQGSKVRAAELLRNLNNWCASQALPQFTAQKLGRRLRASGLSSSYEGNHMQWWGIALKL